MLKCVSPIDGSLYFEAELDSQIESALGHAHGAFEVFRNTPLEERIALCERACEFLEEKRDELALELAWQMGEPIAYGPKEIDSTCDRARAMMAMAKEALEDVTPEPQEGFQRFIKREPLGVVAVIPAWNYPYLIAVNAIVPALLAGNSVIIKHSSQTPLVGVRFAEAFEKAGAPKGLVQNLFLSHADTEKMVGDSRIGFVAFTGSVGGGHAITRALSGTFTGSGMELGGKDPAYVREDADLEFVVENLVDGSFFNSGQSCCGIERIYVHESLHDEFLERAVALTAKYIVGDPRRSETGLGPMAKVSGAEDVKRQVAAAIAAGAKAHIEAAKFSAAEALGPHYLGPQILSEVTHEMAFMREETFGPAVGVMRVKTDEEAIRLMNDSDFGLTASIWTEDISIAQKIGDQVETGTFFLNRCDYLDPELAWVGVKDSGRGCTLSRIGFEQLTRPKSFHLRTSR